MEKKERIVLTILKVSYTQGYLNIMLGPFWGSQTKIQKFLKYIVVHFHFFVDFSREMLFIFIFLLISAVKSTVKVKGPESKVENG